MNNRLLQFLTEKQISQTQLAQKTGVTTASISHILSGRNKPGYDFIVSMSNCFPELNIEWLLMGKGNMLNSNPVAGGSIQQLKEAVGMAGSPAKNIRKIVVFYDDNTYVELD